jgi:hypothetical protein
MTSLNYEVRLSNLHSISQIVETLTKNEFKCTVTYPKATEAVIHMTVDFDLSMDDVLHVGALIGQVQAIALYKN